MNALSVLFHLVAKPESSSSLEPFPGQKWMHTVLKSCINLLLHLNQHGSVVLLDGTLHLLNYVIHNEILCDTVVADVACGTYWQAGHEYRPSWMTVSLWEPVQLIISRWIRWTVQNESKRVMLSCLRKIQILAYFIRVFIALTIEFLILYFPFCLKSWLAVFQLLMLYLGVPVWVSLTATKSSCLFSDQT